MGTRRRCLLAGGVFLAWTASAPAQVPPVARAPAAPAQAPAAPEDDSDLRCWWKSDRAAVRVGEHFDLTLTCRVLETSTERISPDERLLEPAAVALTPFEVVGGTRFPDLRQGRWRFFQFLYTVRIIGDDLFGREQPIPGLEIRYRAERSVRAGEQSSGQDRTYRMPAYPMQIESLVARDARTIMDATQEGFGDMRARRLRASMALVAAGLVLVVPSALTFSVMLRNRRRHHARARREHLASPARVLRRIDHELAGVRRARQQSGWDDALVGRTLAGLRVTGSVALGQPVMQRRLDDGARPVECEIGLRRRALRPEMIGVVSSLTPEGLDRRLASAAWGGRPERDALASGFRQALIVFNRARYGSGPVEESDLDTALESGTEGLRAVRRELRLPKRVSRAAHEVVRRWRRRWIPS